MIRVKELREALKAIEAAGGAELEVACTIDRYEEASVVPPRIVREGGELRCEIGPADYPALEVVDSTGGWTAPDLGGTASLLAGPAPGFNDDHEAVINEFTERGIVWTRSYEIVNALVTFIIDSGISAEALRAGLEPIYDSSEALLKGQLASGGRWVPYPSKDYDALIAKGYRAPWTECGEPGRALLYPPDGR